MKQFGSELPVSFNVNSKNKIMKNMKIIGLSLVVLAALIMVSSFTTDIPNCEKSEETTEKNEQKQMVNMFVTHGHCSTPFAGTVHNLKVVAQPREDGGNPLENMKISFEIDPNSFNVCRGEEFTARVKTPGLFISEDNEMITFRSTNVYTMGMDWYQVNGKMAIKGVERDVKFFVTGIRNPKDTMASSLVLEGQLDLLDWGIDYDKIVNGKSDPHPTKWMHLNMKIEMG